MKKFLLILMFSVLALPSMAFAGLGATTWYCPRFIDGSIGTEMNYEHTIQICNTQDYNFAQTRYAAVEITFYREDGTSYGTANITNIGPGAPYCIRPRDYITFDDPSKPYGSYVIKATAESIIVKADQKITCGSNPTSFTGFASGDVLGRYDVQLQTASSSNLYYPIGVNSPIHNNLGVWQNGDRDVSIALFNPGDITATFVIWWANSFTGNLVGYTFATLAPHQSHVYSVSDYGVSYGYNGKVTVEVHHGSLIGLYNNTSYTIGAGETPSHTFSWESGPLIKKLWIQ